MASVKRIALPASYHLVALRAVTLPPATHINCYIVGRRNALVIDPGSEFPAELDRLRAALFSLRGRGGTLAGVFLTHHHRDHSAGATEVAAEFDLPIITHRETLAHLPTSFRQRNVRVREVAHRDQLTFDNTRTLQVLHTPGHAPGHCCLFEARERILLSGDMILGTGTTLVDPTDGDMALYMKSLAQLASYDPNWILPAHGSAGKSGRGAIEQLLDHRRRREQSIAACVVGGNGGRTALEVTHCAYGAQLDTPLTLIAAYRSTISHLHKLAADGRVRQDDMSWWPCEGSS